MKGVLHQAAYSRRTCGANGRGRASATLIGIAEGPFSRRGTDAKSILRHVQVPVSACSVLEMA